MQYENVLLLSALCLLMSSTHGMPRELIHHSILMKQSPFRVCGAQLFETVHSVCVATGFLSPSWDDASAGTSSTTNYWATPIGIVKECCYKPCSYTTLLSYCTEDNRRKINKSGDSIENGDSTMEDISSEEAAQVEEKDEVSVTSKRAADVEVGGGRGRVRNRVRGQGRGRGRGRERRRGRGRKVCSCKRKRQRGKKKISTTPRSAPVFGTVAPEYFRQPRTLDDVPPAFFGFPGYFE